MSMDLEEFYEVFFEECYEAIQAMESGLLNLDLGNADVEEINTIFRAAHSIKGGSATFDFTDIAKLTHVMETLLDEMRDGRRQVTSDVVDVLLESVDCLKEMIDARNEKGETDQNRVAAMQKKLEAVLDGDSGQETGAMESKAEESDAAESIQIDSKHWNIRFNPDADMLRTGNDPLRLFRELAALGELKVDADLSKLPSFTDLQPEECYLSWGFQLCGDVDEAQIREIFEWVEDSCSLEILLEREDQADPQPAHDDEQSPSKAAEENTAVDNDTEVVPTSVTTRSTSAPAGSATPVPPKKQTKTTKESGSIRVSIEKVDQLINMVGELVITQSMLNCFHDDFQLDQLEKLRQGLAQLSRNTRDLQETAMQIRMLPISTSFNRFPRLVRDMSNKMGKKVELQLTGEGTEVDKTVLEKINDPLVHLVRNSLDHGIEMPNVRSATGKPETGTLRLGAYHEGGNIVIEVIDDGAGLNKERILGKAMDSGIVGSDEELTDEQIYNLIFRPGFSTAEEITDVSGRGVGMDVVRRNINDLGGSVHVKSQPGNGSTLTIRLPLTLAILDAQLVRVGEQVYVISLLSIVESIKVKLDQVKPLVGETELYRLRDEYIPIVKLYDLFNIQPETTDLGSGQLVVVEMEGLRVGLLVDELLDQQQVVIKSLEANFKQIHGLSGATILGDGSVALILDIPGLVQWHAENARQRDQAVQAA